MTHDVRTASLAVAVAVVVSMCFSPLQLHAQASQSIVAARKQPLGSTVSVRGTVTVPSDAFDPPGFALQRGNAGIYVLEAAGHDRAIGDVVTVTGVLVESAGLLAIQPSSVSCERHGRRIKPRRANTGAVSEASEGRLLHLDGQMVGDLVDDSPYGYKLTIDDGSGPVVIFLYPGAGVPTSGLVDGVELSVDCFSSQYDDHYECNPPNATSLTIED